MEFKETSPADSIHLKGDLLANLLKDCTFLPYLGNTLVFDIAHNQISVPPSDTADGHISVGEDTADVEYSTCTEPMSGKLFHPL